jgi:hypothetical protein
VIVFLSCGGFHTSEILSERKKISNLLIGSRETTY